MMVFTVQVTSGETDVIWAAKEVTFPQVGKLFGFVKVLASTMLQKLG